MLKTLFSCFAVLILMATTPFTSLANLLTASRALRPLGLQIVLTYRYISTLLDEASNMWTAYMLRSPGAKAIKMKNMGTFAGSLLLRSFDKAERVYYAMKCRGFSGAYYAGNAQSRLSKGDWLFLCVSLVALCFMRLYNISGIWFVDG
jgi:cobalt/nickel transport system permease protein